MKTKNKMVQKTLLVLREHIPDVGKRGCSIAQWQSKIRDRKFAGLIPELGRRKHFLLPSQLSALTLVSIISCRSST